MAKPIFFWLILDHSSEIIQERYPHSIEGGCQRIHQKRRLKMKKGFIGSVIMFLGLGIGISLVFSADVPRMTKDELKALLGKPDVILLDVRAANDWKDSDLKIQGAIREEPGQIKSWSKKYSKEQIIVLYCA
jgi:hypothetical protein